jgi:uncharacterized protein YaeQ
VLAFALHADPALGFGRGLSSEDEPDLAISDDTGQLQLWIAVGLPDEKWLRKAAARAPRVVLLTYGGARADLWWRQNQAALARHAHLRVLQCDEDGTRALAAMAQRTMSLSCTVQEGEVLASDGQRSAAISLAVLKPGLPDGGRETDRQ